MSSLFSWGRVWVWSGVAWLWCAVAVSQPLPKGSTIFFDSLAHRLNYLESQIPKLQASRDVGYYNVKREIDLTRFLKACEEYCAEEDLDNALKMTEKSLDRAESRGDQYSVKYYEEYKNDLYNRIKRQRMYYQGLFAKEKNFKKEFERQAAVGSTDNYQKTLRTVNLAMKYARENNLIETVKYLENYHAYTEALIFDAISEYDLSELTSGQKAFEKAFLPLVESDSINDLTRADQLIRRCTDFARLAGSPISQEYLAQQAVRVTAAMSDLLEQLGREKELERYTDQSMKASTDTVNACGIFKWRGVVIVIDEFLPKASMENVKKGEAIIHADQMLAAYLKKNKLCDDVEDLTYGQVFVIPFTSKTGNSSFKYNPKTQKWQYIICYTSIVDEAYTRRVSQFMPPILFAGESGSAKATTSVENKK